MALNEQQMAFKNAYVDPSSETFSNAYKSALKAGYTDEYSKNITAQGNEWFSEILRDKEMLDNAEKALAEAVSMAPVDENGKTDSGLYRVKVDAAKFVAKGLNKQKWAEQANVDHSTGGKPLTGLLNELFNNVSNKKDSEDGEAA